MDRRRSLRTAIIAAFVLLLLGYAATRADGTQYVNAELEVRAAGLTLEVSVGGIALVLRAAP